MRTINFDAPDADTAAAAAAAAAANRNRELEICRNSAPGGSNPPPGGSNPPPGTTGVTATGAPTLPPGGPRAGQPRLT